MHRALADILDRFSPPRRLRVKRPDGGGTRRLALPRKSGVNASQFVRHEYWMTPLLRFLCERSTGAFLDVGANLGQTLVKFLSFGSRNRYYAFEPNPSPAAYLEELVRVNRLSNVHVVPVGLSDRAIITTLYLRGNDSSTASTIEHFRDPSFYSSFRHVPLLRGDEVIGQLGIQAVSAVKIDVEGGELEVIAGLAETIERHRPPIVCEILPIYDASSSTGRLRRERTDALQRHLLAHRYDIFRVLRVGGLRMIADGIETHGDLSLSDYLFLPSEQSVASVAAFLRPRSSRP